MKTWKRAFKDAVVVGSVASLTSLAGMAFYSRRENGTVWPALNAPSHWLWGEPALAEERPSLRYTAAGLAIHHLSSGFWGVLHQKALDDGERRKSFAALLRDAAVTTAVAAVVDLQVVPKRLSPGFEHRLSKAALAAVYGWFALGLAAGSYVVGRGRPTR